MTEAAKRERHLLPLQGKPEGQLLIHEIYRSIQGESSFAGLPCVFVRLAVCDARCTWCDTPHAFVEGTARTVEAVLEEVAGLACPLVEVTGGEPLLQPEVFGLMTVLADRGHRVLLETSGLRDIRPVDPRVHVIMDIKCPASGESERNRWDNLDALKPTDEVKLVVASREDFEWAEAVVRERLLHERFGVIFSPVFGKVAPADLAEWVLDTGLQVRMQVQLHKYIWDPKARGV